MKRLSKQSKLASTRQRAMILLASNTLMSAPEIAHMLLTDESHVRKVIHDFNRHGFESLRPRFRGGRPRRVSIDDEQRIVAVAGARPDTLGVPYTPWSLSKLSRYLRGRGIEVSPAQLGRILARNGISLQRTRSWKQSPDPDYSAKAARILALYREKPKNGVVISFDEKGPESLSFAIGIVLPSPLTDPFVTVSGKPSGNPSASTSSPRLGAAPASWNR